MNLINEKLKAFSTIKVHHNGISQEMLKGLCFNCDHRKTCTWKEDRKLLCEHFQ